MLNCSAIFTSHELWLKITLGVVQSLEILCGCVTNIGVLTIFFKQNKLTGITALFMVNLAITDLAMCCIMIPLSLSRLMLFPAINTVFHIMHESLLSGLRFISVATLTAISYDRMRSATRPLRVSSPSNAKRIICGVWLISVPSFLLPIFTTNAHFFRKNRICSHQAEIFRIWDLVGFIALCLAMLYNYRGVQCAAKHRAANLPFIFLQQSAPVAVPEVSNHLSSQLNKQKKKVINLSRLIISSALLFWTPYLGLSCVSFFIGSSQTIEIVSLILLTIGYFNHVLHPVLYAMPSSKWREAAFKTFPLLTSVSQRGSITSAIIFSLPKQRRITPCET
eukprot:gene12657-13957_t